ncbi:MAG: hypothetical protein WBA45_09510 [Microthrixaceae bacterium]
MQSDQRERLLASKLTGLVRSLRPVGEGASEPEARGALTVMTDGARAYGLIEMGGPGPVASAVLWARRNGCAELVLFVDEAASTGARFASYFSSGDVRVSVLEVAGSTASAVVAEPAPATIPAPIVPHDLIDVLRAQQLEVVAEHGVIRGELLGLEVARLVRWPAANGGDDELHLEAGVGRFDRDAVAAVNADMSPEDALGRTLEVVRKHRYSGAPVHPLQLLSRERWLRVSLLADPGRVGAKRLEAVAMTTEAPGMRDPHPAAAYGEHRDGQSLIAVCSTGINMATVPLAADLRAALDPSADLVILVPERDRHSATVELAAMLEGRVEVLGTEVDWG